MLDQPKAFGDADLLLLRQLLHSSRDAGYRVEDLASIVALKDRNVSTAATYNVERGVATNFDWKIKVRLRR